MAPEKVTNRTVEFVEGKGWLKTCPVHEVFVDQTNDGLTHVHKANCRDLYKYGPPTPWGKDRWEDVTYTEATSIKQIVEDTYRYGGSFYAEDGIPEDQWEDAWRKYVGEFKIFSCVSLPDEPTYEPTS